MKRVQIVYFSGTGGTKKVVEYLEKSFNDKGVETIMTPLDKSDAGYKCMPAIEESADILVVAYAVHAFDAPIPIFNWIEKIEAVDNIPCAVISVSGGGEMWPNTACRIECIKQLESKGFNVFYERMFPMPCNVLLNTKDAISYHLLKILPQKTELTAREILNGVEKRRKRKPFGTKFLAKISKLEQNGGQYFCKNMKTNDKCNGCNICANNCPMANIKMEDGHPIFGNDCALCMRCICNCPQKAIYLKKFKYFTTKKGYNLSELEKRLDEIKVVPPEKIYFGILYWGIRKYLRNKEF